MPTLDHDADLVAHLLQHHHAYARRAIPYIIPLLSRVAGFHGRRNGKLESLCEVGTELAEALEAHLEEEERELFPALLGVPLQGMALPALSPRPCNHRAELTRLLAEIRSLADGYTAPEWASLAYRVLMEELEALDEDVAEYMHLENYVLAPRLAPERDRAA